MGGRVESLFLKAIRQWVIALKQMCYAFISIQNQQTADFCKMRIPRKISFES